MRVAIVGPGAIGATFGACAAAAGHEVVLCARRPLERGIRVDLPDGASTLLPGPAATAPPVEADWTLLAVKAHQTDGAAAWLDGARRVAVLQNGIEQRELAGRHTDAGIVPAVVWCPAEGLAPDHVRVMRGPPRLVVPDDALGRELRDLLGPGGAQVDLHPDWHTEAWQKLCVNAVAGLMALAGRPSIIFRDEEVLGLARRYAVECVAVAQADGADLGDATVAEILAFITGVPPEAGSSILTDRLAGRPLEWDARNAVIVRRARAHGMATPISDVVVPLLRAASEPSGLA